VRKLLYRTFDEIIQAAILTTKDRLKYIAEKNTRRRKYNEKVKKRIKK
jgi:hypothetical protein